MGMRGCARGAGKFGVQLLVVDSGLAIVRETGALGLADSEVGLGMLR
jgi:hypothetical protein